MTSSNAPSGPDILTGTVHGSIAHAMAASSLFNRHAMCGLHNSLSSGRLAAAWMEPALWTQSLEMQRAVVNRLQRQQHNWANGCTTLAQDYARIGQANTVSKLVEKQYDLIAQFTRLMSDSATDFIGLMENIEVAYGYWASGEGGAAA